MQQISILTWTYAAKAKNQAMTTFASRHVHGLQILATTECWFSSIGITLRSPIIWLFPFALFTDRWDYRWSKL